jgi:hypothetical protein
MDLTTAVTLGVTVALALLGYLLTHRSNLRVDQRRARLARVNEQLSEFYGPLFALSRSGEVAWRAFRSRYRPSEPFWSVDSPASAEELAEFRRWMTQVFMPNNRLMRKVIVGRADLLDEHEMPEVLVALLAHVASYEVVLGRWEDGDVSQHRAIVDFPGDDFAAYTADAFRRLKAEQVALLGRVQPRDGA